MRKSEKIVGIFGNFLKKSQFYETFLTVKRKRKSPTNGSVEPFLRLLSLEAPPRFELGDQSFAVPFREAIIVDIEPF